MPFKSEAQRRFLWANHPDIAHAWAHGRHTATKKHRMPSQNGADVHVGRKKKRRASSRSRSRR